MTVLENLQMGARPSAAASTGTEKVYTLFPRLKERRPSAAARCRAASSRCWPSAGPDGRPRLLLLDEPSLGLAPLVVKQIFKVIRRSTGPKA